MTSPLMTLEGVNKSFSSKHVLQNISLQLNQGEITTLIGPNGAGKSTLVRIVLGLLAPDSGTVCPAANLNVGYMPQKLHIDPTLPISTCRFLQLANTSHSACHSALESVGIGHLAATPIQKLSGGEMQRALLAPVAGPRTGAAAVTCPAAPPPRRLPARRVEASVASGQQTAATRPVQKCRI